MLCNLPGRIISSKGAAGGAIPSPAGSAQLASHTFGSKGKQFLLDGEPFQVISGEMHCLFAPSGWLNKGSNQVVVLDLEPGAHRTLQGIKDAVWTTGVS